MNCWREPTDIDGFDGVIVMEVNVGWVTFSCVVPVTDPDVALIVVEPTETPDASPVADTVATEVNDEAQVTVLVKSLLLPSL